MNVRDELLILQKGTTKAIERGYLQEEGATISSCNYILEPPSIYISRIPLHETDNNDLYLTSLCPLTDPDWALAFWGKELMGNVLIGIMPAWKYHQHRLLGFVQDIDWESYFKYLELYI